MSVKRFERKCGYCDRIFSHCWNADAHEKKCDIRNAQAKTLEQSTQWQKPGWHGPEMSEDETFQGFKEGD